MHYKRIYKKIFQIEKEYKFLKKDLFNQPLLSSKKDHYLSEEKEEFKILWFRYIKFFEKLKKLLRATSYRRFFFWINYNKLVLNKYLVHFYYKVIADLLESFWNHEEFMRVFLDENFGRDYWVYAKYIYRPKYINTYNTPILFIEPFKPLIDKDIFKLVYEIKDVVWIKRISSDYTNLFYWIKYRVNKFMFFVIRFIWNLIAHTRFTNRKYGLIKKENLQNYIKIAKPGDILLTRWNWNASNISIPGFWKHMSMYIWNGKYIKEHYKGEFIYELKDQSNYIIEATSLWVNVVNIKDLIEHNDYLGVFRTSFSKDKIKRSIKNALSNVWKWYDFIFNYYSDKKLVCSALVLKSFAKENQNDDGIEIELEKISIWLAYPPNNFIQKVKEEQEKKDPELEWIFFIDTVEKTWENFISTIPELFESGKRSRFSMFLK